MMKRKITILMFSLLLAVGWTNDALAQSATYKAADLAGWKYTWTDAQGNPQESTYVVLNDDGEYEAPEITNAYQIYGFLKAVYMDKRLPGPWQSAYKADGVTREDDIYYGGCANGWNIPYVVSTDPVGDITITFSSGYADFRSITVTGNNGSTSWSFASYGTSLPNGWSSSKTLSEEDDNSNSCFLSQGGTITVPASLLNGSTTVQVVINARRYSSSNTPTITINNVSKSLTSSWTNYTWNIPDNSSSNHPTDTYKPTNEGYTAIIVSLQNETYKPTEPSTYGGSMAYTSPSEVIDYISRNIKYVKLLTDGLRITGSNPGTVFNCDGTYNKFFFLGKGKARQKGQEVLDRINANTYPAYAGECVAFWPLFEEFSPSTPVVGQGITDFFDKMREGNVYSVVHDCAGVIQNTHEFSLSGPTGTTDYPFSGMNFFIPDYRLKYWVGKDSVTYTSGRVDYYDVDGRDMNAMYDITNYNFKSVSPYYSNFCQYNPDYAPKVGIYKITLEATLSQVSDSHQPGNSNFVVTLTWVSSLDQLSGLTDVPQTFTVYYYDPVTGERKYVVAEGITDGKTGLTTVSYPAEQKEHGYILDHIVMGQPDNNDHHSFVAWSNHSAVTIPGWDDFVSLVLDHHESDFVIDENSRDNWYRNFLSMVNEDKFNGLTIDKIRNGMNSFNLYRQELKNDAWSGNVKIATITFDQIQADQVHYTVTYEPGQEILESPKYTRASMDVPDEGWVRIKGNGDLVIWPNGFFVNFKSIIIKNGNNVLAQWNVSSADISTNDPNLPSGWELSPGSKMLPYINSTNGEKVCYIEGGGYIYIPNMVTSENSNITVEIVAYTDGAHVGRIEVNDKSQSISNAATTYIWGGNGENQTPLNPSAAPRHDKNETNTKVTVNPSASSNKSQNSSRGANHSNVTINNSNKR